jgi:phosphatidylglycerol---prolipoprotein diacylglyceryl transferase
VFPQLFHIGNFFLPTYGFLVSMGVLLGLWISVRNSERLGYDGDKAWNLGILVVLCGIVGAKILYIVNDWSYYTAHPGEIFSIATLQAGGVFSGGLLAAFLAAAPAMLSLPDWPSGTRWAALAALPPDAATGKRRITGGAWSFTIRWRTRSPEHR